MQATRATQFGVLAERNFIAPVMNLSEAFIPLLLTGPCLVFYPVCLFSCDVDVQSS
jgi:hypothetical protein